MTSDGGAPKGVLPGGPPPTQPPQSAHLGDASMIWPPFIVVAVATAVAGVLTPLLASALYGGAINLDALGYVIGIGGYALFTALFLWLDAIAAAGLSNATWSSRGHMWRQTLLWALLSLGGAVMFGTGIFAGLAALSTNDTIAWTLHVLTIGAVLAAIVTGGRANVRARRRTRVDPNALR